MDLTPVEERNGRWYKREDMHRGLNGANGAKLRACEHLIGTALNRGATTIITAASILSPQHAIVSDVCKRFNIEAHHIVGATNPASAKKHVSVAAALSSGANFHYIGSGFNASLQKAARDLAEALPGAYVLPYGISTPSTSSPKDITAFARVGGHQVENIPQQVKTLVVPFGSGNSATGILTGMHEHNRDFAVKLMGIGPSKYEWMQDRLKKIGVRWPRDLEYIDLHGMGFATYSDKMPETRDGIAFHPTYEGKIVRYLDKKRPSWWTTRDGTTCMWIVGGPIGDDK